MALKQIDDLQNALKKMLGERPLVLWYHRGTARFFFIILSRKLRKNLKQKLNSFIETPWFQYGHFTSYK